MQLRPRRADTGPGCRGRGAAPGSARAGERAACRWRPAQRSRRPSAPNSGLQPAGRWCPGSSPALSCECGCRRPRPAASSGRCGGGAGRKGKARTRAWAASGARARARPRAGGPRPPHPGPRRCGAPGGGRGPGGGGPARLCAAGRPAPAALVGTHAGRAARTPSPLPALRGTALRPGSGAPRGGALRKLRRRRAEAPRCSGLRGGGGDAEPLYPAAAAVRRLCRRCVPRGHVW